MSLERLLTMSEAADYLNVPQSWLANSVRELRVPHTRIGKHVRFTSEHLAEIIRRGEQKPQRPQGRPRSSL